ncbi:MAG TPA: SdrD B-like domain-containing protein [Acidimicrobiia bacterium]|nr:SdrD B-like domain-containing protein [Acidimicrobiia bacterium]
MRRPWVFAAAGVAGLIAIVLLVSGSSPGPGASGDTSAPTNSSTSVPSSTATTGATSTTAPTTTGPVAPPREPRYIVPEGEVEVEAKQLASDIAYALTTYEESDDPIARFFDIAGSEGVEALTEAGGPLTHLGRWSRGQVLYPQLGGLTDEKVSVMVVTRQTVGFGADPQFTLVRTLDIRLIKEEGDWEFDQLASAGGVFASIEDLQLAHAVAADPRIEMPDSARLDILEGLISPVLLDVMLDIADITPYGITVMATGHPYHVFETNRVSHHTGGRAIDINRVGDRQVIDDRGANSTTRALVQRLWEDPRMVQVGSPWDTDGGPTRSFANTVHQDHIHVAVIGPGDPTWVPAIGDRVWEDLNANGVQDPNEPGISGVTVRLYDGTDRQIGTDVTDGDGRYEFRNLWYGDYHVEIDIPSGFLASPQDQGPDEAKDSDIDSSGVMARTTLDPREHDPKWDAGLYRRASIGDRVWNDLDADGIQDAGEPGVAGVTVRLFDGAGVEVGSTVTNGAGEYSFENLTPGAYHVEVVIPGGFVASLRDQGSDDSSDSDMDSSGVMAATALDSNENDLRWDAGLTLPASIGDLLWEDLDGDGIQDEGEPGVAGVTVRLFNSGGTQVRSTVTDANGEYLFSNLRPGVYHIEIDIPEGFAPTLQDEGLDEEKDSDADEEGVTMPTTLGPGENDLKWDIGLVLEP